MTIYILNSPILTGYGDWRFEGPLTTETARERIAGQPFESAVGHQTTADFLSHLLGVEVPCQRISVRMKPGDSGLVLRLLQRISEGKVLGPSELARIPHELGWLEFRAVAS